MKKLIHTLQPLRDVTIEIAGHQIAAEPTIDHHAAGILTSLGQ